MQSVLSEYQKNWLRFDLVAVAISVVTVLYRATHPLVYVVGRKPGAEVFCPLTGEHPEVLRVFQRSSLGDTLGHARMFFNLREAVKAYEMRGVKT